MQHDPIALGYTADLDRRQILRALLGALALPTVAGFGVEQALALGHGLRQQAGASTGRTDAGETLDGERLALVAELAERIVPRTDTSGAKDAQVDRFIDQMLTHWFLPAARAAFLDGIDDLETRSQERFQSSFAALPAESQDELLQALADQAQAARGGGPWALQALTVTPQQLGGGRFFEIARWLVLVGYYTSELGMNEELGFRRIPGRYESCPPGSKSAGQAPGEAPLVGLARQGGR